MGATDVIGVSSSAEGERVRFYAGIQELNLEPSIDNAARLANQLIQALFGSHAVAARLDVETVRGGRRLPIERDAKADRAAGSRRSHHQMQVAGMKVVADSPRRSAKARR